MPPHHKAGAEGWNLGARAPPGLKELTIEMGDSDIYINMSRRIDLDSGHTLFEAVLTDPHGSRAIYIDRDDILECLKQSFIPGTENDAPEGRPKEG